MAYDCLIIGDTSAAECFNLFEVKISVAYNAAECPDFFETNAAELMLSDIMLIAVK